jgi:hypothetical protein
MLRTRRDAVDQRLLVESQPARWQARWCKLCRRNAAREERSVVVEQDPAAHCRALELRRRNYSERRAEQKNAALRAVRLVRLRVELDMAQTEGWALWRRGWKDWPAPDPAEIRRVTATAVRDRGARRRPDADRGTGRHRQPGRYDAPFGFVTVKLAGSHATAETALFNVSADA